MQPRPPLPRWLLLTLGHSCIGLAIAGAILPLVPMTPFLLLAAACYIRSSEKHYAWLLAHPIFGTFIRNYREQRAIPVGVKYGSLVVAWVSLAGSTVILRAWERPILLAVIGASALISSTLILRIKTLRRA